jgi:hypothetical protein
MSDAARIARLRRRLDWLWDQPLVCLVAAMQGQETGRTDGSGN